VKSFCPYWRTAGVMLRRAIERRVEKHGSAADVIRMTNTAMRIALIFVAALQLPAVAGAQRTVIRAGQLLDVRTGTLTRDVAIVVTDRRIVSVGATVMPAAGDRLIDLSNYTVLPGLIDGHVHLAIGGPPRDNALADLRAGFTTVVDLGARTTRLLQIRDSINAGLIPGPRVLAAGIWIGRKDGVCEFNGIGIPGGAEGFRARVRENAAAGADVIKACVSGWPAAAYASPNDYELPDSVLATIVEESRRLGRKVIAHDISRAGVRAALRAGVNGLAHAAYVDPETAGEMQRSGMFMIPTLTSLTAEDSSAGSVALRDAVRIAYQAGVPLVFGTDGGVLPHGRNALEFATLVKLGVPALETIRAATINAARAFGLADSVGTIAPGMIADLIAVAGDPLTDPVALQRVRFVMRSGQVVLANTESKKP
jgi:imidazolonepropionase-like amidohydrolase